MPGLTATEIASGIVAGARRNSFRHPSKAPTTTSWQALQRAVLPALLRPPCLVSFSGGLDSSFVLAAAADVARSLGLPAPIPCTWRFSDAPRARESTWQDRIVDALRLDRWVQLEARDELDLVGPVAQRMLHRLGLVHPVNVHLHLPLIERAAGGSFLTGAGGDQILCGWRRSPHPTAVHRVKRRLPSGLRATVQHARGHSPYPWLRPYTDRKVIAAQLKEQGAQPKRFADRVDWHAGRRSLAMTCSSLAAIAVDHDVRMVNPLVDPGFIAALATEFRGRISPTRQQVLATVGDGRVPPVIYERDDKARFLEVFFRTPTRDLVSSWDGSGVDPRLVDISELRRLWSSWPIPPLTGALVQQVYLAGRPLQTPPLGLLSAAEIRAS